jgi:hypothetical protein
MSETVFIHGEEVTIERIASHGSSATIAGRSFYHWRGSAR